LFYLIAFFVELLVESYAKQLEAVGFVFLMEKFPDNLSAFG
jgi:hypothetical protein